MYKVCVRWSKFVALLLMVCGVMGYATMNVEAAAGSGLTESALRNGEVPFSGKELTVDARQVVFVQASKDDPQQGVLTLWKKIGYEWCLQSAPIDVVVGKAGIIAADKKREGDKATPAGTYALKRAFGYDAFAKSQIPYTQLSADDFWVDEVTSPLYNKPVKGKPASGSYEQMRRDDHQYKFGIVVEYNTDPIVKGKGSAIFMHIWKAPGIGTSGCIAMSEEKLVKIIKWLDPDLKPVIVLQK